MNPTLPSEVHLVRAFQQHRSTDFALLYDAYAPALYGMLLRLLKDPARAADLLQDAFVKIWSSHQTYDPQQGRLFSWMLAMTRNLVLDELNSQGIRPLDQVHKAERPTEWTNPVPVEATAQESWSGQGVWKLA